MPPVDSENTVAILQPVRGECSVSKASADKAELEHEGEPQLSLSSVEVHACIT